MPPTFIYDLLMALIPGAIGGYYAALLISKYAKFNSLKYEALRLVRKIEYFGNHDSITITRADNLEEIQYISSELLTLKHRKAGKALFVLSAEILGIKEDCASGKISGFKMNEYISKWQSSIRKLRPGLNLFVPWGQL